MYLWITVMHKKMSHPNEIQNTKVKITFEDTLNYVPSCAVSSQRLPSQTRYDNMSI